MIFGPLTQFIRSLWHGMTTLTGTVIHSPLLVVGLLGVLIVTRVLLSRRHGR